MLSGQNTDAGGGGTGKSFKKELTKFSRVDPSLYMDATCAIHGHNLTLKNPVAQLFGKGGLSERNALQLIHSAYNLQYGGGGGMELQEFEQLYAELFNGKKWKCMTCPVMTRWYTVSLGAKEDLEEWESLKVMAKRPRQTYSAESAPNKCTSALTPLLAKPGLRAHVEFISAYHET